MKNYCRKKGILAAILIVFAFVSFFGISRYAASPDVHRKTINALDDKKKTVLELTAASTAASVAITLIPGDTATPVAEKLADLSSDFLLVLCAIYIEKYLVTVTGYVAFCILIPIACLLFAAYVFKRDVRLKNLAVKLAVFGLSIFLVIPASVKVSGLIEKTYASSIQDTLDLAKQTTEEIEDFKEGEDAQKEDEEGFSGVISKVTGSVADAASRAVRKVENSLNRFIEALAVMIVTSCVIPILVILFFIWFIRAAMGVSISLPAKRVRSKS